MPTSDLQSVYSSGSGGGGLTGLTSALNTASPNDGINAASITPNAAASGSTDLVIAPKSMGALIASVPDGLASGGNKRGYYAVDLQTLRSNNTYVATGDYSVISGGRNNSTGAQYASVGGGYQNIAFGTYCRVGGGNNNTIAVSADQSTIGGGGNNWIQQNYTYAIIAGGRGNTMQANYGTIGGGYNSTVYSDYATIAGGSNNIAMGQYAAIGGGSNHTIAAHYTAIPGGLFNYCTANFSVAIGAYANSNKTGQFTQAAGTFGALGDCQSEIFVYRARTTDATATELACGSSTNAPDDTNAYALPTNTTVAYDILVVAREENSTNSAAWQIRGAAKRGTGWATLLGTPLVQTLGDDSAGAWTVAAVANSSQRIQIKVTGAAGKNIRWGAHIRTMQIAIT